MIWYDEWRVTNDVGQERMSGETLKHETPVEAQNDDYYFIINITTVIRFSHHRDYMITLRSYDFN